MATQIINGVAVECVTGDIAQQTDMDAVVNAANAQLRIGGGVAGAIHRAAGPKLEQECRQYAPIKPGQTVVSQAYQLPNRYVIHCLGPVYGVDTPAEQLLADCYRHALQQAETYQLTSVAFPAISSGAFGYPLEEAARVALETVAAQTQHLKHVTRVRFVLFSDQDAEVFTQRLHLVAQ